MVGKFKIGAVALAAFAAVPARPSTDELRAVAEALIPAEATRGIALHFRAGFSLYRDVRLALYQKSDGGAVLARDVLYADGKHVVETAPYEDVMFADHWERLLSWGIMTLPDAPATDAAPLVTDAFPYAVAARDGGVSHSFVVEYPGGLENPRYFDIISLLESFIGPAE